jgi:hypothetical protein
MIQNNNLDELEQAKTKNVIKMSLPHVMICLAMFLLFCQMTLQGSN